MEKKITFRMWLSVFFGGIGQFFRNIFSWKNKSPFWRVIWSVITVCIVIFTCAISYAAYHEFHRDSLWIETKSISPMMNFARHESGNSPGWIANACTGEVITTDIDWIITSEDDDSLAVFSSKGKRGYINRYSGKIAIVPQFDKAWVFSSGVAGVEKNNKVFFIDHTGNPVNNKTYDYMPQSGYIYHGDYCIMNDENGMLGLINREGNWEIEPKYDWISAAPRNYWKMREGNGDSALWYAFSDKAEQINDFGAVDLDICEDLGIIYTLPNHLKMVIDFEGNRSEKFLCNSVDPLYYETEQRDSTLSFIPARCTLYRYRMDDGYEGLCKENGDIVTEPLYWTINPIGKDLYLCTYKDSQVGVIVNSKGEVVRP